MMAFEKPITPKRMAFEKPITPKRMAKLMLLDIKFYSHSGGSFSIYRGDWNDNTVQFLRHISPMKANARHVDLVVSKTKKRAVSKALQSMDKTRFYWK